MTDQPEIGGTKRTWKERAREFELEVRALSLACRDPRVPWFAKALAAGVVAYALSPLDLIPDPIPILGHLDDVVLVPLGVLAVRRMIPSAVMAECRERARNEMAGRRSASRTMAAVVVLIWLAVAVVVVMVAVRLF